MAYNTESLGPMQSRIFGIVGSSDMAFVTIKGPTSKNTQDCSEWFHVESARIIADLLIDAESANIRDVVLFSEGDKQIENEGDVPSGPGATISTVQAILAEHLAPFERKCWIWGISNKPLSKLQINFGVDRVLGCDIVPNSADEDEVRAVWPEIEASPRYAGPHLASFAIATYRFKIDSNRTLSKRSLAFYGGSSLGRDFWIHQTHATLLRVVSRFWGNWQKAHKRTLE